MRTPRSCVSGAKSQSPSWLKASDRRISACIPWPGASGVLSKVRSSRSFARSTTCTRPRRPFAAARVPWRPSTSETGAIASSDFDIVTEVRRVSAGQAQTLSAPLVRRRRQELSVGGERRGVDALAASAAFGSVRVIWPRSTSTTWRVAAGADDQGRLGRMERGRAAVADVEHGRLTTRPAPATARPCAPRERSRPAASRRPRRPGRRPGEPRRGLATARRRTAARA